MGLYVNTNVASLNAQRQLFESGNTLSKAFEQLSSGFRINSAADDAAGLQISDRMTSQIQGLNQSVRNANDAISLVQTAEGALAETTANLQRLRQLSVQAQNGINSDSDKNALQKEADALLSEIDRIANATQFAGQDILQGAFSTAFQVGANAGQQISVGLTQFSGAGFGVSGLGINGLSLTGSGINPDDVTGASALSANQVLFNFQFSGPATSGTYSFAVSNDGGASYKEVTVSLSNNMADYAANNAAVLNAVNGALGAQVIATESTFLSIQVNGNQPNFRMAASSDNPAYPNSGTSGTYTDSGSGSGTSLTTIDGAISRIGSVRAELGATQNRFQSTIRNLSTISENLSSSRSRIRDTDFAATTAELTRNQIMQQAATTVLAQANQRPQTALSLLG